MVPGYPQSRSQRPRSFWSAKGIVTSASNLWPGSTPELRDSRTSRHSAHAQSQVWQISLVLVSIYCVYKAIQNWNRWTWPGVSISSAWQKGPPGNEVVLIRGCEHGRCVNVLFEDKNAKGTLIEKNLYSQTSSYGKKRFKGTLSQIIIIKNL